MRVQKHPRHQNRGSLCLTTWNHLGHLCVFVCELVCLVQGPLSSRFAVHEGDLFLEGFAQVDTAALHGGSEQAVTHTELLRVQA